VRESAGINESAGRNRHGAGDENALHRRSSESRWPRVMRWRPVRAQRSVDRGRVGWAIEPRNPNEFRVPTLFAQAEGHAAGGVTAGRWWTLRGRRTQARTTSSMRENREIPRSPVRDDRCPVRDGSRGGGPRFTGREGNAEAVRPRCTTARSQTGS
jgi:hypothetical protein